MQTPYNLYFHSPCFDGIVSAVLMSDFLSTHEQCDAIRLHCVNYHLNDTWKTTDLETPSAVVDFLYHPQAQIWFDHHRTTFLDQELENDFRNRVMTWPAPLLAYDPTATSCALLIWRRLRQTYLFSRHREAQVLAADRVDSAQYASPEEAVFPGTPAARINASLAVGETEEYSKKLVTELRQRTLDETAALPEVLDRYQQYERLSRQGLERFHASAHLEPDGIVVFDVDGRDVIINRYVSFLVYPNARYSLGVVRNSARANFTAMRNPWLDFPSIPLGQIFARFGGGGHDRVASTRLYGDDMRRSSQVLSSILEAMRIAMITSMPGVRL